MYIYIFRQACGNNFECEPPVKTRLFLSETGLNLTGIHIPRKKQSCLFFFSLSCFHCLLCGYLFVCLLQSRCAMWGAMFMRLYYKTYRRT